MFDARLRLHLFPTPTDADGLRVGAAMSGGPEPWLCGWTHFLLPSTCIPTGGGSFRGGGLLREDESWGGWGGYT